MAKTIAKVACGCKNEFQDRAYGQGVRIANRTQKSKSPQETTVVRCTSCGREHSVNNGKMI